MRYELSYFVRLIFSISWSCNKSTKYFKHLICSLIRILKTSVPKWQLQGWLHLTVKLCACLAVHISCVMYAVCNDLWIWWVGNSETWHGHVCSLEAHHMPGGDVNGMPYWHRSCNQEHMTTVLFWIATLPLVPQTYMEIMRNNMSWTACLWDASYFRRGRSGPIPIPIVS